MKPTFKTTVLAILVSLDATACLSNSDNLPVKPSAKAKVSFLMNRNK